MKNLLSIEIALAASLMFASSVAAVDKDKSDNNREGLEFFEKKIRPVLVKHCYECHSADTEEAKGGLLLDTREGIRKGGDSGHAVVPRDVKSSLLIDALSFDTFEMPPDNPLPDGVVRNFVRWIKMGAPDPRSGAAPLAEDTQAELWSLKPIAQTSPPQVKETTWPSNDIDRYVLARLQQEGLTPVADADRVQLLRRLYLDLIGLPPSPIEIDEFLENDSEEAYMAVVDSLLASPQFGERWGRHWLDVVRFAESNGKDRDVLFPNAWRYRDYVIDAFNSDKPFDRFVTEQIAGDLLPADTPQQRDELNIATGFLALTSKSFAGGEQFLMDIADDQIDVTGRAILGLTISCARCHDHKFDPVPSKDYYALVGVFRSTETRYGAGPGGKARGGDPATKNHLLLGADSENLLKEHKRLQKKIGSLIKQQKNLSKQLAQLIKQRAKKLSNQPNDDSTKKLSAEIASVQKKIAGLKKEIAQAKNSPLPKLRLAMGVLEGKKIADYAVLIRGEVGRKGEVAPRGFLTAVPTKNAYPIGPKQSGRLQLTQWITDPGNPLMDRVMANRVWSHLLGRGLVRTVDNFGFQGDQPSHPELLDYLATQFQQEGRSVKKLIRGIVSSRTYQLSTAYDEASFAVDPDNTFLWRRNQRRLEVEVMRDSLLAASGRLSLTPPEISLLAEIGDGEVGRNMNTKPLQREFNHRSVYLPILRSSLPEMLKTFDFAEPSIVVGSRSSTTIPAQALYFMNSPFVLKQAEGAAGRILEAVELNDSQRVTLAFKLTLARLPDDDELQASLDFIKDSMEQPDARSKPNEQAELTAWSTFCQALFATAEFRYVN